MAHGLCAPARKPAGRRRLGRRLGPRSLFEPLSHEERTEYLAFYGEAVARAYEPQPWGGVLLPFPRLFVVAAR